MVGIFNTARESLPFYCQILHGCMVTIPPFSNRDLVKKSTSLRARRCSQR